MSQSNNNAPTFINPTFKATARRRGQVTFIAIVIVIVALAVVMSSLWLRGPSNVSAGARPDAFSVRRGSFDISVPVSGELAALKQIEVRNNLDSRAIITDIVAEGTYVQKGDIVLRLNDEELRTKLRDAQDRVNVAESSLISAEAKLQIQIKARDLAVELAQLALKAWEEGEAKTRLEELELAVKTNEKEYQRLADRFEQSKTLVQKDFISQDELRRDEIAMMQAEFDFARSKNELMVYKEYQYHQDRAQKESDLEQARIEREAEVRSARSEVESKRFQLDSAKETLHELQQQLSYCTVAAPAPGLVVYFASTQSGGMGRNEGRPPIVGTELSRNELVIILPDTSQMIAAVKVNEALVGQIQVGQRATVTSDATPDHVMSGQVMSVGVMAETGGWRDPNRRDYTVRVKLDEGGDSGLKPSMRCKANIYIGRVNNALYVPIQAVFRAGPISYVYTPKGNGYAETKIVTGPSSESYIEIVEGLNESDLVLLRQPSPEEIVSRIPIPKDEKREREGEQSNDADASPAGNPMERGGNGGFQGQGDSPGTRGIPGNPGSPGSPGSPGVNGNGGGERMRPEGGRRGGPNGGSGGAPRGDRTSDRSAEHGTRPPASTTEGSGTTSDK